MTDETWMRRALDLAARGRGAVEPNPMVGAVVVGPDGTLAGEGWHERFGGPHAEVNAFAAAGAQSNPTACGTGSTPERARGGTLYVTLEPCCHVGKTPPCTDAVLRSGVKRVVVAMADPFPKVAGGGLAILRAAGIEVVVGVGEDAARRLNAPYLMLLSAGRPWVIAKWAMTLDGKIATRTGDSQWISGPESRAAVHELRGRVDAVIVGRGTVVADDPLLTARPPGKRVAARVVLSASGDLPERCRLRETAGDSPVIVFTAAANAGKLAAWTAAGAEVVGLSPSPLRGENWGGGDSSPPGDAPPPTPTLPPKGGGDPFIGSVLAELGRRRFTNVLVEGGAGVLGSFLDAGAIDEVWAFVAPVLVGGSGPGPVGGSGFATLTDAVRFAETEFELRGPDVWVRGLVRRA